MPLFVVHLFVLSLSAGFFGFQGKERILKDHESEFQSENQFEIQSDGMMLGNAVSISIKDSVPTRNHRLSLDSFTC